MTRVTGIGLGRRAGGTAAAAADETDEAAGATSPPDDHRPAGAGAQAIDMPPPLAPAAAAATANSGTAQATEPEQRATGAAARPPLPAHSFLPCQPRSSSKSSAEAPSSFRFEGVSADSSDERDEAAQSGRRAATPCGGLQGDGDGDEADEEAKTAERVAAAGEMSSPPGGFPIHHGPASPPAARMAVAAAAPAPAHMADSARRGAERQSLAPPQSDRRSHQKQPHSTGRVKSAASSSSARSPYDAARPAAAGGTSSNSALEDQVLAALEAFEEDGDMGKLLRVLSYHECALIDDDLDGLSAAEAAAVRPLMRAAQINDKKRRKAVLATGILKETVGASAKDSATLYWCNLCPSNQPSRRGTITSHILRSHIFPAQGARAGAAAAPSASASHFSSPTGAAPAAAAASPSARPSAVVHPASQPRAPDVGLPTGGQRTLTQSQLALHDAAEGTDFEDLDGEFDSEEEQEDRREEECTSEEEQEDRNSEEEESVLAAASSSAAAAAAGPSAGFARRRADRSPLDRAEALGFHKHPLTRQKIDKLLAKHLKQKSRPVATDAQRQSVQARLLRLRLSEEDKPKRNAALARGDDFKDISQLKGRSRVYYCVCLQGTFKACGVTIDHILKAHCEESSDESSPAAAARVGVKGRQNKHKRKRKRQRSPSENEEEEEEEYSASDVEHSGSDAHSNGDSRQFRPKKKNAVGQRRSGRSRRQTEFYEGGYGAGAADEEDGAMDEEDGDDGSDEDDAAHDGFSPSRPASRELDPDDSAQPAPLVLVASHGGRLPLLSPEEEREYMRQLHYVPSKPTTKEWNYVLSWEEAGEREQVVRGRLECQRVPKKMKRAHGEAAEELGHVRGLAGPLSARPLFSCKCATKQFKRRRQRDLEPLMRHILWECRYPIQTDEAAADDDSAAAASHSQAACRGMAPAPAAAGIRSQPAHKRHSTSDGRARLEPQSSRFPSSAFAAPRIHTDRHAFAAASSQNPAAHASETGGSGATAASGPDSFGGFDADSDSDANGDVGVAESRRVESPLPAAATFFPPTGGSANPSRKRSSTDVLKRPLDPKRRKKTLQAVGTREAATARDSADDPRLQAEDAHGGREDHDEGAEDVQNGASLDDLGDGEDARDDGDGEAGRLDEEAHGSGEAQRPDHAQPLHLPPAPKAAADDDAAAAPMEEEPRSAPLQVHSPPMRSLNPTGAADQHAAAVDQAEGETENEAGANADADAARRKNTNALTDSRARRGGSHTRAVDGDDDVEMSGSEGKDAAADHDDENAGAEGAAEEGAEHRAAHLCSPGVGTSTDAASAAAASRSPPAPYPFALHTHSGRPVFSAPPRAASAAGESAAELEPAAEANDPTSTDALPAAAAAAAPPASTRTDRPVRLGKVASQGAAAQPAAAAASNPLAVGAHPVGVPGSVAPVPHVDVAAAVAAAVAPLRSDLAALRQQLSSQAAEGEKRNAAQLRWQQELLEEMAAQRLQTAQDREADRETDREEVRARQQLRQMELELQKHQFDALIHLLHPQRGAPGAAHGARTGVAIDAQPVAASASPSAVPASASLHSIPLVPDEAAAAASPFGAAGAGGRLGSGAGVSAAPGLSASASGRIRSGPSSSSRSAPPHEAAAAGGHVRPSGSIGAIAHARPSLPLHAHPRAHPMPGARSAMGDVRVAPAASGRDVSADLGGEELKEEPAGTGAGPVNGSGPTPLAPPRPQLQQFTPAASETGGVELPAAVAANPTAADAPAKAVRESRETSWDRDLAQ